MNGTIIALVKPSMEPLSNWVTWEDGLYGAFKEMAKEKNLVVHVFGYAESPTTIERDGITFFLRPDLKSLKYAINVQNPRVIFGWGTSFHPWDEIVESPAKKILLYAGGEPNKENAFRIFDHVVVENESDKAYFGTKNVSVAFGTNTDLFKPVEFYQKMIPAFYPAAFAKWKRHDLWARSVPTASVAIGQYQDHEQECYRVCVDYNHIIMPQVSYNVMPHLYNQSLGVCLTPSRMGGCQRAALESMACNVPVLATNDSKASEFDGVWSCVPEEEELRQAYTQMVMSFVQKPVNLREEYIIGKLDHYIYAFKLKELL